MALMETASSTVFDQYVEEYEAACQCGLSLAGENRDFFARKRVEFTRRRCRDAGGLTRIIDFGCGLGHTVPYLQQSFPQALILGIDASHRALEAAAKVYAGPAVDFAHVDFVPTGIRADLVYCNGVFHHIDPAVRPTIVSQMITWLRPGGLFALWENNPWNPGTRLVMKRIPFDRDAIPLSYRETSRLLSEAG
ncbi:MAG: class I SAM-dependent methyltransferase, partial [Gemmataceae bacterium]|nr:class I SAM-dependent methyltransferase [Gemmataceae bacterium]